MSKLSKEDQIRRGRRIIYTAGVVTLVLFIILLIYAYYSKNQQAIPTLSGTVRDGLSGQPLAGVNVVLYAQGQQLGIAHANTLAYRQDWIVSDENGKFFFQPSKAEDVTTMAEDYGYLIAANYPHKYSYAPEANSEKFDFEYSFLQASQDKNYLKNYFPAAIHSKKSCRYLRKVKLQSISPNIICTNQIDDLNIYLVPVNITINDCGRAINERVEEACRHLH